MYYFFTIIKKPGVKDQLRVKDQLLQQSWNRSVPFLFFVKDSFIFKKTLDLHNYIIYQNYQQKID